MVFKARIPGPRDIPSDPQERIEDLALALRKWAQDHDLKLGTAMQEVVTALFVATRHTAAPPLVAETISKEAWAIRDGAKGAISQVKIDTMARNVNDILRGRA